MSNTPPTNIIRDGALKASIWQNEGEKGIYFTTKLAKTYEDKEGVLRDTSNFSKSDLLRVSELARKAYDKTNTLTHDLTKTKDAPEQRQDGRENRASSYLQNKRDEREHDHSLDMDR